MFIKKNFVLETLERGNKKIHRQRMDSGSVGTKRLEVNKRGFCPAVDLNGLMMMMKLILSAKFFKITRRVAAKQIPIKNKLFRIVGQIKGQS